MSENLIESILSVQPKEIKSGESVSIEDIYEERLLFILDRIPVMFNLEELELKYKTS